MLDTVPSGGLMHVLQEVGQCVSATCWRKKKKPLTWELNLPDDLNIDTTECYLLHQSDLPSPFPPTGESIMLCVTCTSICVTHHMYTYTQTYIHTHTHHIYTHTYTHTYTYTQTHIHTHTSHIHTHICMCVVCIGLFQYFTVHPYG